MWQQKEIILSPKPYGFHLITKEVIAELPEIKNIEAGLLHILIQHTSAGLTLNENADSTVRSDFKRFIYDLVFKENGYFEHIDEGDDDMPAHIKSSLIGAQLSLPISNGRLQLGVWQGIYLGEFRKRAGNRRLFITIQS
ncbi:MAG: hypothetical protein CL679_12385 [Bermanella sp.]|nr:hypothetical protein [Bermanella sp.]|tara:strand:+ start:3534 stop:3950 length:417 start_codon:yes stop_codon:yes gene_type:complete